MRAPYPGDVGKARAARKLAAAAAYGGGGLSVVGGCLYALLRLEAVLARKAERSALAEPESPPLLELSAEPVPAEDPDANQAIDLAGEG